ncbi:MAG: NAD-dependent epimerase/dehydratase family protein [Candidatus Diapherotrites archaeon]|uniref:NAD-dependent epimerase/dehydratase family protein n=1 Tax=Candidatus Iainarchaeum sp. TaxID=3101447 RepID=A0A8T4L4E7_9ARCH|nr:NAD-dependent epimerase/dehydratase family protein [Candidatus Diapherotrites archaeon]
MSKIRKIIVTGSSGMIGTALCERLISEKIDFIGVDKVHNQWSKAIDKKTVIVDLTKSAQLEKISSKADLCVHLAANAYVFPSVQNPQLAVDNVLSTLNTLEFCRKNKISRLIFASSREVYGNTPQMIHDESDVSLENTESPYAASKISGESFVVSYQKCFGIDYEIFRFSNVYGKFDTSERFIPIVLRKSRQNEPITIFGKEKSLAFTYIDDAIEGIMGGIKNFETAKNEAYNLAFPQAVSLLEVAKKICQKNHSECAITVSSIRPGEVEKFEPRIVKAQRLIGFSPRFSIDEGLEKTIAWYNHNVFLK